MQDLVRKNKKLVIKDYYGEEVEEVHPLQNVFVDQPGIQFLSLYDDESSEDDL